MWAKWKCFSAVKCPHWYMRHWDAVTSATMTQQLAMSKAKHKNTYRHSVWTVTDSLFVFIALHGFPSLSHRLAHFRTKRFRCSFQLLLKKKLNKNYKAKLAKQIKNWNKTIRLTRSRAMDSKTSKMQANTPSDERTKFKVKQKNKLENTKHNINGSDYV